MRRVENSSRQPDKRVMVTGATGNVGTNMVPAEPDIGAVLGLARRKPALEIPKVEWDTIDLSRPDSEDRLAGLLHRAWAVVHLAGHFQPILDHVVTWQNNVLGSQRVFGAVARSGVPALVHACSVGTCSPGVPAGGSIINTTSVQAYKPSPHLNDYAMAKGAIVTFNQGLAQMLASDGIRVNAVAPGPVWTPLIPATLPDTAEFGKQSPLGRPAQPAEMAPAYVFLASASASFITGEIMNATGGTPLP